MIQKVIGAWMVRSSMTPAQRGASTITNGWYLGATARFWDVASDMRPIVSRWGGLGKCSGGRLDGTCPLACLPSARGSIVSPGATSFLSSLRNEPQQHLLPAPVFKAVTCRFPDYSLSWDGLLVSRRDAAVFPAEEDCVASRRVLIVGGVAGGAACAARLRRMDEKAQIVMFERGADVSFANCGLPYYIGGVISDRNKLLLATPTMFQAIFNVEVRVGHEVTSIDPAGRTIEVKNVATGRVSTESYDALVLAPGARPIVPPIEGADLNDVHTLRSLADADRILAVAQQARTRRTVVVGAGFIGLEIVENLVRRKIEVTLIERADQVLPPADPEMAKPLEAAIRQHGVTLELGNGAGGIEWDDVEGHLVVVAEDGKRFETDAVILAVGVKPEVELARQAGLEIGDLGGIRVDNKMQTSEAAIWAVGDAVEVRHAVTGAWTMAPLAGPAARQGRVAADVIADREASFRGSQMTAVVGLFNQTFAMTGASERALVSAGMPFHKSYTHSPDHADYYPGAKTVSLKTLYDPQSGRLLGAQAVGAAGVDKRIDVLAMAIQKGATVFDLEEAELCYAPPYGAARDVVNVAGFVAANQLRGDVDVVHWDEWQALGIPVPDPEAEVEPLTIAEAANGEGPLVIDVRPPKVIAKDGQAPGTLQIPLGQLRDRLDELPRDREIWVHCGVGKTSYYACRILSQNGFRARNLSGGFESFGTR